MCGIVAYIGSKNCIPLLISGLQRLEYRGYDSSGIACIHKSTISDYKAVGKVKELNSLIEKSSIDESQVGIAHTRWATHGLPSEANAHPHLSTNRKFAVVHNGIIENYKALKSNLEAKGCKFQSETDSEVIAHLIEQLYDGDLVAAVASAVKMLVGAYGLAVIASDEPDKIVAVRNGSPIVIGISENESIIASDLSAIVSHTKQVIFLNDNDIAIVTASNVEIRNQENVPISREIDTVDWDFSAAEKSGYEHFMLKEIFEQPEAVGNAIRGRLDHVNNSALLSGLNMDAQDLVTIKRIIIAACGTSLNAGLIGEYYLEDLAGLVTEVEQAAEFRYRNPLVDAETLCLIISQSGETADSLAALREAKLKGSQVAAICNVVGSTISRESGRGIYLHAGPEIGVASTKAFTCQVSVLLMMALKFARARRYTYTDAAELINEIEKIPEYIDAVLKQSKKIEKIAKRWAHATNWFFIGRGYQYPVALEAALKLKEISYHHAEGYHAAELKHGPIALLDENFPVVALAADIDGKDKTIGNIEECLARKAPVIICATQGDKSLASYTKDLIEIPASSKYIVPITATVAMQLLAYYVAKERGEDIDQPRNLAKSVTVE